MAIFLGIDGGGTKTAVAAGNDSRVLGTGIGGGSNVVRLGAEKAREGLREAILNACDDAGVSPSEVAHTVMGVAGASVPEFRENLKRLICELVPGTVEVVGDNEIAMHAAFSGGPGVIVVSGTGSIAFGRNAKGESARAGGWGHAISDEGSGHWIGKRAVAAEMRAFDRGEKSSIFDAILRLWSVESRGDVVRVANAVPGPDFSKLFPVVAKCAKQGDRLAKAVLDDAGQQLAKLAETVVDRLFEPGEKVNVAMVGGAFGHSEDVRKAFIETLSASSKSIAVARAVAEPVLGALAMARAKAQQPVAH